MLFFAPVVPISVQYACEGPASLCATISMSTYASVTYAVFSVGAVHVVNNNDPSGNQYCWMNGNPVTNAYVNLDSMCGYMVQ
jgi:hypothetical protein